jgi:hypothetical protein
MIGINLNINIGGGMSGMGGGMGMPGMGGMGMPGMGGMGMPGMGGMGMPGMGGMGMEGMGGMGGMGQGGPMQMMQMMMQMMQMMMQMMQMMMGGGSSPMMGGMPGMGGMGMPGMGGMGMPGMGMGNMMGNNVGNFLGMPGQFAGAFAGVGPNGAYAGAFAGGTPMANPNQQVSNINNPNKGQVGQMIEQAAAKYGVPVNILKAVAWNESRWDAGAVGDHGKSHGVMQIYQNAHPQAYQGAENVGNSTAKNIEYGAKLLRTLHDRYGSWDMAVKRYNGSGPMADNYAVKVMGMSQSQPWRQSGLA